MFDVFAKSEQLPRDFAACSGCSLCLLVCPVWRKTRDLRFTPHGRAKAMQHGVAAADLKESIDSCTLCGACVPACPENIDLVGMTLGLRRQLPPPHALAASTRGTTTSADYQGQNVLLAGKALRKQDAACRSAAGLLGCTPARDDGDDIALALEAGAAISPARRDEFLLPLRKAKRLVVADALLARELGHWLPQVAISDLGMTLSRRADLRGKLRAGDLYVIEPRAFHADYEARVRFYDDLRHETGCAMSLDLQRIAIPATARNLHQRLGLKPLDDAEQTRWLLQGRKIARIVVEDAGDVAAFKQIGNLPVVHLAELAHD